MSSSVCGTCGMPKNGPFCINLTCIPDRRVNGGR